MQTSSKLFLSIFVVGAAITAFVLPNPAGANSAKDAHRPRCSDARCRRIKSFLKAHYCGESPFGNGPEGGCEIRPPKNPHSGVDVIADFKCEWNETKRASECRQLGRSSLAVRNAVLTELHRLGLPPSADKGVLFAVWKPASPGWFLAQGTYYRTVGSTLRLCDVIAVVDSQSNVTVLRAVRFQTTDTDVPTVTTWTLIDVADVDGDNSPDIILEGDAYENHWFEVASKGGVDSSWKTIFSGLGYYL